MKIEEEEKEVCGAKSRRCNEVEWILTTQTSGTARSGGLSVGHVDG